MYVGQDCKIVLPQFCLSSLIKAVVRTFFLVKNDPKSVFEQVHNQPVFKTMALFYPNSQWLAYNNDEHGNPSLRYVCKHKEVVPASRLSHMSIIQVADHL